MGAPLGGTLGSPQGALGGGLANEKQRALVIAPHQTGLSKSQSTPTSSAASLRAGDSRLN